MSICVFEALSGLSRRIFATSGELGHARRETLTRPFAGLWCVKRFYFTSMEGNMVLKVRMPADSVRRGREEYARQRELIERAGSVADYMRGCRWPARSDGEHKERPRE